MARTTSRFGTPDAKDDAENRGDHWEVWYYYFDDSRLSIEFRWGYSYDGCQQIERRYTLMPEDDQVAPRMLPGFRAD